MASRDDMVITPNLLGDEPIGSGGVADRRVRKIAGENKSRRGVLRNLALSRGARIARLRGLGVGRLLGKGGPIAMLVFILGAIALRVATGKNFENFGAILNEETFGDLDDESRAMVKATERVLSNPFFARSIANRGGDVSHLAPILEQQRILALQAERGRSIALQNEKFTAASKGEVLIDRSTSLLRDTFNELGGHGSLNELNDLLKQW